jgi:hypothetical protein
MRKKDLGLVAMGCMLLVLLSFGLSWGQIPPTLLVVVRAGDDSLWKMTCNDGGCTGFSSFPGMFRYQPTVTWDEASQEWILVGTAADNSIWMSTFNRDGNFNNDWVSIPGQTASPAGASSSFYKFGGDIITDRWLNSPTNTFFGVGVAGAGTSTNTSGDAGWYNTAVGYRSFFSNTTGIDNTAIGNSALLSNTTGINNVASGAHALHYNTEGNDNTASGHGALYVNTTGFGNTASGKDALVSNTEGQYNTASGIYALYSNTIGTYNTAIGIDALNNNTAGSYNIAIGDGAGYLQSTGNRNIYIGSAVYGVAGESNVMRIGNGQTQTYIAGINGIGIGTGSPVYVNSSGQLGTSTSSRRFKEEISDMGEASNRLMALRPVTFRYNSEIDREERPLQYGLIAEEVAEVYPDLVQYEKGGEPFSVRYHELSPMLLNEAQKQYWHIQEQDGHIRQLTNTVNELTQALNEKDTRVQKLEKMLEAVQDRMALIEGPRSK